jgi:RNA polymerase sigma-70 factor (sigma-E family)
MGFLRRADRREYEEEFIAFYTARSERLRATAYLLCGDRHLAEDLTQTTFIKLYRAWPRIDRRDTMDRYAQRVLLNAYLDERRRPWRREVPITPSSPELDGDVRDEPRVEEWLRLRAALMRLPPRQRAVLVLRFWADLSLEQVADAMGCSVGTVKSQSTRGTVRLRELLTELMVESDATTPGGDA